MIHIFNDAEPNDVPIVPLKGKAATQKDQINELYTLVPHLEGKLIMTQAGVSFIDARKDEFTDMLDSLIGESKDAAKSLQGQVNDLITQMQVMMRTIVAIP